jgi:hypothetical protein
MLRCGLNRRKASSAMSLTLLTPKYLKGTLRCPEAQADTYSETYVHGTNPAAYTVWCAGAPVLLLPANTLPLNGRRLVSEV